VENLLSNAIKFGAGKPVGVALAADGGTARLTVRDQGIGISEEDQGRIFQRFERAVTRREHGGFGIGLWLVHQLVLTMGGAIAVVSALDAGTTFTVTLPLGGAQQQGAIGA
jgi:signal transduction histidine kinase